MMETSIYPINKGINKSIELKGLKEQYIWYLAGGVVALMIVFAIMYIIGLPSIVCVVIIAILGVAVVLKVYAMSNKYGEHGLMKELARKQVPTTVRLNDRNVFMKNKVETKSN